MEYFVNVIKFPTKVLKKLYNWTKHWSRTGKAPYALFAIAFAESSFFPIPPDVLLIPMTVAHREKWLRNALICTAGSVLGGILGYIIGWSLYQSIGKVLVETYHLQDAILSLGQKYADNAFLTVFSAAFTPIPFKAITISAGLFGISLPILIAASLIGRAGRFFLVAGALRVFGKKIEDSIEKYFDILSILFLVLLVGGILIFRFVF